VVAQQQRESLVHRYRFVILFFTLLLFIVVAPLFHQVLTGSPAISLTLESFLFLLLLSAAVISVSKGRGWRAYVLGLGLPAVLFAALHAVFISDPLDILRHMFGIGFLIYVIAVILRHIFRVQAVTFNTVCSSLCIYLLLGVVWALAYSILYLLDPHAIHSNVAEDAATFSLRIGKGEPTTVLYFSFVTLTTLGYGDIIPVSPTARALASTEAITGQLFLTVLVARLVGLHIVHSLAQQDPEPRQDGDHTSSA
jgi:hypothetical protein